MRPVQLAPLHCPLLQVDHARLRVLRPIRLIPETGVRRMMPLAVITVTWSSGLTTHAAAIGDLVQSSMVCRPPPCVYRPFTG